MKLYLTFTLLLAVDCKKLLHGDQVLRINAGRQDHLEALNKLKGHLELDFWTDSISTEWPVDVRVPHASLNTVKNFLKNEKIPFDVMINNLQKLLNEERAEMMRNAEKERKDDVFNFAAYHPLEEIYKWMDSLVGSHPKLVSKVQIGESYEKRPMFVLKFSTGGAKKPAIWIDAGIHAREWVSHATAVWIANQTSDCAPVRKILGAMDIYLLIVANPDGYFYSQISPDIAHRLWRKNRSKTSNPNCPGVDLNRNWDAHFGDVGASNNPCNDTYHGPSANSEVEVKNMVNLIRSHGNFKSFISIHSYSQLLMYPHGYNCTDVPHQAELDAVATAAVQQLTSLYNTSYRVGSICKIIYPASGGSIDWTYDIGIKYSFAFELRDTGGYGFLLPANQIIPTAEETWLALKYIMGYVCGHPY